MPNALTTANSKGTRLVAYLRMPGPFAIRGALPTGPSLIVGQIRVPFASRHM
jgi:hypothetical protein